MLSFDFGKVKPNIPLNIKYIFKLYLLIDWFLVEPHPVAIVQVLKPEYSYSYNNIPKPEDVEF